MTAREEFDSTSPDARDVAGDAASNRDEFLELMPQYYRGEVSQSGSLLARLDLTTDWAIVVVTAVLALAFQGTDTAAYLLLIGMVAVTLFLLFDVRRYRTYDASRSRIRLLEENLFANSLHPSGAPLASWRVELGDDLRTPTLKVSYREALSRRLRRVYYPLYLLLGVAWLFRVTRFAPDESMLATASVPGIPGSVVVAAVVGFFLVLTGFTFWPLSRRVKGEFHGSKPGVWKR